MTSPTRTIEIMKSGTYTDVNGQTVTFSEADMQELVDSYDPATDPAPAVVGHPKTDAPAYAWAESLAVDNGRVTATIGQIDPDFGELVQAGRYKRISASIYPREHGGNPKAPGTLLDRRDALLAKKAELEKTAANDPEAAAKLADIMEQLYQISEQAFGTAGAQFAGDRSSIKSTAQTIIDQVTATLTAAQEEARKNAGTDQASTDALLGTSNTYLAQLQQLADEGNAQSAEMIALLRQIANTSFVVTDDTAYRGKAYEIGAL